MPIKGLTETRRLPRLGKIHLGIKKKAKSGASYPSATEYFVVPPEVAEKVGDKPIELPIVFPIEDDEKFASQFYRSYSMTRGLVCRGDGDTCRRMVDAETGEMANRDSKNILWKDGLPCEGRDCPYYEKQCKEVMNLQFLLPTIEGLGVWQIDTSSINSIRNINSAIELIRGVYGRIAMIPLLLTLEPIEVTNPDDGKKKKVRVLNLRTKGTMIELMKRALKPAREMLLPVPLDTEAPEDMDTTLPTPDDEPPELIMPQNQAPKDEPPDLEQAEKDADNMWPPDTGNAKEAAVKDLNINGGAKTITEPEVASSINIDWLKESLKKLKWGEKTVTTYLTGKYKVEGGLLKDVLSRLNKEQQGEFVKEIQDRLDMLNN